MAAPPPHLLTIAPLATFSPAGTSRAWCSVPHPSAPLLATASSDKSARIYSLTDYRLHSIASGGHKRSVRAAAWKPGVKGESVLATGSFDASVGVWRRWDDGEIQVHKDPRDEDEDEDEGVGEEEDGWRFSVILDGHESEVKGVAFNAGGQYLATCSRDKTVWVWEEIEEDNWETVAVLQEHEADIKCVVWHPQEDLLASGSYDDTIRLYREDLDDWACIAVLMGHESTVWGLAFEPIGNKSWAGKGALSSEQQAFFDEREKSGPRLISCSDDTTIRVWQRKPKEHVEVPTGQGRMPSILRTHNIEEDWFEATRLPQAHSRAVYAVGWSPITGRVVSAGSDGKITVYEEQWITEPHLDHSGTSASTTDPNAPRTEWVVVAELDGGHGVFEINDVCWTKRRDKDRKNNDEEIIITTGDDGEVKAWTMNEK
ncbi:cytosolic iron-sulfur protein assembly protein 1 [Microthyrium microscopicum]|uniref:Probable cytosolic iron-sulfur protein assembly protein 1 n=1 Tax=Microthyrium microscopicum TaxID=703497 RepID=A0A6A6U3D0_9PEZI|nr:cytosolic iron-sulfur protein assembly protein 1 [Microthyrium microscopicum]